MRLDSDTDGESAAVGCPPAPVTCRTLTNGARHKKKVPLRHDAPPTLSRTANTKRTIHTVRVSRSLAFPLGQQLYFVYGYPINTPNNINVGTACEPSSIQRILTHTCVHRSLMAYCIVHMGANAAPQHDLSPRLRGLPC